MTDGVSLAGDGVSLVPPSGSTLSVNDGSTTVAAVGNITLSGASVASGGAGVADITIAAGLIQHVSTSFTIIPTGTLAFQTIAATSLLGNATGAGAVPAAIPIGAGLGINSGSVVAVTGGGLNLNNGTIGAHAQVTVNATAGANALTLAAPTTNLLINGPAAGGGVTLTLPAAAFVDQRIIMNISQGATAATWTFGAGFNFGTTVPTPTITAAAGKRDNMTLINNVGTVFDFEAINQGFSP